MSVNNNMGKENEDSIMAESFEFPNGVLSQISECTPEGFILFTINEHGDVDMYQKFSVDVIEAGLRCRAMQLLKTMNSVEDGEITAEMLRRRHPESGQPEDPEDQDTEY